jgi:hypothetical protein
MGIVIEHAIRGGRYLWGAPTFDQVRIGWDETRYAIGGLAQFSQQRMEVTLPSGGVIRYRSLDDPDNARGHTADGIVIDECADVNERAWYEVLRPMLIDTGGWAWMCGTPNGRNWYWREFEAARDRPDSIAWQAPSLGVVVRDGQLVRSPHPLENPNIPFVEIDHLWRTLPERVFRQEILAEFVDDGGGVFRRVLEAVSQPPDGNGSQYAFGVDWGKHNDWTVVTVIDIPRRAVVEIDRFNQIDYAVQTQRLRVLANRYHPMVIMAEANAMGEPIIEQLQRAGLPVRAFTTTNVTKAQIIETLALAFECGGIHIPSIPVLVNELQAYEMSRLPSGQVKYGAPDGMHDDCVMSLALAWHAANQPSASSLVSFCEVA